MNDINMELIGAIDDDRPEAVLKALQEGADVNSIMEFEGQDTLSPTQVTPLLHAIMKGREHIVGILLDHNADMLIADGNPTESWVPFKYAVNEDDFSIVRMMLIKALEQNLDMQHFINFEDLKEDNPTCTDEMEQFIRSTVEQYHLDKIALGSDTHSADISSI